MPHAQLSEALRKGRKSLGNGWTQGRVRALLKSKYKLEVSQQLLSFIENGKRMPRPEILKALATEYGLNRSELVTVYLDTQPDKCQNEAEREWMSAYRRKDLRIAKKIIDTHFFAD